MEDWKISARVTSVVSHSYTDTGELEFMYDPETGKQILEVTMLVYADELPEYIDRDSVVEVDVREYSDF